MSHKQIEDEIKYRFSCLLLDYMLEYILILSRHSTTIYNKKEAKAYNNCSFNPYIKKNSRYLGIDYI